MFGLGILSGLLIVPLCGAAFILTLKGDEESVARNSRWAALATTVVVSVKLTTRAPPPSPLRPTQAPPRSPW